MPTGLNVRFALASATFVVLVGKFLSWRRRAKSLPPGPSKLPFIDNLHNMPKGLNWVQFHEIAKQHNSDIIHMSTLGFSIVVLDTFEAAQELLENRSGLYSSRHVSIMKHELSGLDGTMANLPYGDHFRISRRLLAKHLGTESRKVYQPRELFYTRRCLVQLLESPNDFLLHLNYLIGSINLSVAYGLRMRSSNDESLAHAKTVLFTMKDVMRRGMFLVDVIPVLKYLPSWFPGAGFQRIAANCSQLLTQTKETLFKAAEEHMDMPNYLPSFFSENLREAKQTKKPSDIDILKNLSLTLYAAAMDTTSSTLGTFMLAMVCYPEVQKKLQEELDAAFSGKLPDHNDVAELPYLQAVFMEVLRWKPVTPIGEPLPLLCEKVLTGATQGIPHATTLDDVYKGYFIPKNSVVIANQWAMLRDPEVYPEPTKFDPERFLKNGKIDASVRSPYEIAFGFGRRICPGRHIAQSTFMVVAASILSTFDLQMKTDEHEKPILPPLEYHLSVSHTLEFSCDIVPRSAEARQLIASWAASEGESPP